MRVFSIFDRCGFRLKFVALSALMYPLALAATPVLLETEGFREKGGWVVDQQFMDQMGSPYLMAHGCGRPVADAVTTVSLKDAAPTGGVYRVWVRTRDWVVPHGPGRFRLKLGLPGGKVFWESGDLGVGGSKWNWTECGTVGIPCADIEVRLHDLTGFDGRCDAVIFSPLQDDARPEDAWNTFRWRRNLLDIPREVPTRQYDFVVVGGGYAGMCAAVAAARRGVRTALVQDRPVFGGNASSEVRVGPIGKMGLEPFPRNSDHAYELWELTKGDGSKMSAGVRPKPDDARIAAWIAAETNLSAYVFTRCVGVECADDKSICSVVVRHVETGRETRLKARHFADCTGDGWLAVAAGARYREEPETFEQTGEMFARRSDGRQTGRYGSTNFWLTRWTKTRVSFPDCPWALRIESEDEAMIENNTALAGNHPYASAWNWESGLDKDAVRDGEWIRDYNFRAAYGMWDYLKNRSPDKERYACAEISWMGYVLGKRAARRIEGDYILTEQDLVNHRTYPDGVVTTTWYLDMHFPDPRNAARFPEGAFLTTAYDVPGVHDVVTNMVGRQTWIKPYPIPFRCFYSTNVPNLWMAGKDISCTYVGMASVRVENTTAQMGTMVGRAVSLCVRNGWTPRQLGCGHFDELKTLLANPGPETDLARRGRLLDQNRIGLRNEALYWMRKVYHNRPLCRMIFLGGILGLIGGCWFLIRRGKN